MNKILAVKGIASVMIGTVLSLWYIFGVVVQC